MAETLLGGLLSESDLVTHAFELLNKAPLVGILLLALDKVITAEFFVWLTSFEQMIDDYEDGVSNGNRRFLVAVTPFDAGVLGGKIRVLRARCSLG